MQETPPSGEGHGIHLIKGDRVKEAPPSGEGHSIHLIRGDRVKEDYHGRPKDSSYGRGIV